MTRVYTPENGYQFDRGRLGPVRRSGRGQFHVQVFRDGRTVLDAWSDLPEADAAANYAVDHGCTATVIGPCTTRHYS